LRKRKTIQKIDKEFSYSLLKDEASNSSEEYHSHSKGKKSKGKRTKKQQSKITTTMKKQIAPKEVDNKRYVPDGISIFDLIMPWKQDVVP